MTMVSSVHLFLLFRKERQGKEREGKERYTKSQTVGYISVMRGAAPAGRPISTKVVKFVAADDVIIHFSKCLFFC